MKQHLGLIINIALIHAIMILGCREEFQYDYDEPINPEPIDGISAGYVNLYDAAYGISIDQYSSDGKVILTCSLKTPEIRKGSIITVDLDTMGYIRRVLNAANEGNKVTLETEQAYLNDVFVDIDFTLNTEVIPPVIIVDSKGNTEDLVKSLTDKNGHIHPVEIFYYDKDHNIQKRSARDLITKSKDEDYNIIDFYEDFSGKDLYGKDGDNIHFYIDEGHASLVSDAILDFDFDYEGELDEDTKVKKGDLRTFSFYLDSKVEFLTMLALEMSKSFDKTDVKKLFSFDKVTAKFFVGAVPVWVSVKCDLWGAYQFNSTASLYADWGFESIHTLKVGGTYNGDTEILTPIKEYNPQNSIYPLNIKGDLNAYARIELFPRADILFYSFFGPFAEIVPYVEGNYTSAIRSQISPGGSTNFLAWNSNLDVGLDFRVGAKLTFLGLLGKEFGPTIINCFNNTLWNSPKSLELLTDLPQEAAANSTIPLGIIVKDNLGLPIPFCSVCLQGDGSFSNDMPITNLQGQVNSNWLLDDIPGDKKLSCSIYNALGEKVDDLTRSVMVQGEGAPIADFIASPVVIFEGESVQFTDQSANSPTSWSWDFGDGESSTQQNPVHTFNSPANYTVSLTVTNNSGSDNETKTDFIKVSPHDTRDIVFNSALSYGLIVDIDNNFYRTIQIGSRTWMAENLRTTKYNDGTDIPLITDKSIWINLSSPAYCWYNNDPTSYKPTYGALYNWYAINTGKICPIGWHVPSESEWNSIIYWQWGGWLKEIGTYHWMSPNTEASNETGFTAIPGGYREGGDHAWSFVYIGEQGYWWTATASSSPGLAVSRNLSFNFGIIDDVHHLKQTGLSIRCIKD